MYGLVYATKYSAVDRVVLQRDDTALGDGLAGTSEGRSLAAEAILPG
jgi:hypothetical protein